MGIVPIFCFLCRMSKRTTGICKQLSLLETKVILKKITTVFSKGHSVPVKVTYSPGKILSSVKEGI